VAQSLAIYLLKMCKSLEIRQMKNSRSTIFLKTVILQCSQFIGKKIHTVSLIMKWKKSSISNIKYWPTRKFWEKAHKFCLWTRMKISEVNMEMISKNCSQLEKYKINFTFMELSLLIKMRILMTVILKVDNQFYLLC
jgi:hypothetical protein